MSFGSSVFSSPYDTLKFIYRLVMTKQTDGTEITNPKALSVA